MTLVMPGFVPHVSAMCVSRSFQVRPLGKSPNHTFLSASTLASLSIVLWLSALILAPLLLPLPLPQPPPPPSIAKRAPSPPLPLPPQPIVQELLQNSASEPWPSFEAR